MNDTLLYALAISALLVSDIALVVLGVMLYRSRQRVPVATLPALEELRQELAPLAGSLGALDQRLVRIEQQLSRLHERSEQQPLPAHKEADHKAFEVAAKLVSQGADVDELIAICGLTRGEAELILRLYGASRSNNPGLIAGADQIKRS